ncbi:MAG TPA: glycoside hydrolase family 3 N-terminal domain-containing protein [Vicinamibacteria bacterium]|nr:glycoside hydrolase family 3 N-terminal domain-containing protein [Vicinamibacteria bacterium]
MRISRSAAFVIPLLLASPVIPGVAGPASPERHPVPAGQRALLAHEKEIDALIARMTLDEKIGQMTQPDQQYLASPRDIAAYHLGSLLSGGDSDPKRSNSFADWREMIDGYHAEAQKSRLQIPLLYGVDAVHGHNNVVGAVVFPQQIGLGATRDAGLVEEVARITAKEVRATGANWTFAPCVTVPRDERWGRSYEGFGEDTTLVRELGAAAVRGFQGPALSDPLRVAACAKHYVGDGGTVWGTGRRDDKHPTKGGRLDQGDVQLEEAALRRIHLAPYADAIAAGVATIMPSYSSWNGVKCSGSRQLLTEILKNDLGFQGFLISDYAAIDQLPGDYRSDVKQSIGAGMDMVMVPEKYQEFIATLKGLIEAGEVDKARIDDAVRRILRVKFAMGLAPGARAASDAALAASFGSAEHRAVARRAVRQSLVLLKNEKRTLPLAKDLKRIHVAGRGADDMPMQAGGWTVYWQGLRVAGKPEARIPGTSILAGIQAAVSKSTTVTHSKDGAGAEGADAVVVVVGEEPYAEFEGDRSDLSLGQADKDAIAAARKAGKPLVVVLLSGRPMVVTDELGLADAFVAAWLPGTEGAGVADVLFGDHKPSGKLPMSWPRSNAQIPVNVGDATYDPLYKYGYGLTY